MQTVFIGFDQREAVAYHVCCQSIIERASKPVCIVPLAQNLLGGFDGQRDGTNAFIYSRFLVPALMDFGGWALFIDGDMILRADIGELFALADDQYAAMVVPHDYQTKHPRKYIGTGLEADNLDYPRKNWSSVVLWNCGHPANRTLTVSNVSVMTGKELHRLTWLTDEQIGYLPRTWNWLVGEYAHRPDAKLVHYTLGVPGFSHYCLCDHADAWYETKDNMMNLGA